MSFLKSIQQFQDLMQDKEDIVIVDVRFQLTDPDAGKNAYLEGHIPDAVFLDVNKDLSGQVEKHGGSHPLPDRDTLAYKLGEIGIDQNTTVIIYDENNDMFSARCLWLFHYLGHDNAYILDGGWTKWIEEGNEVTADIPKKEAKTFKLNPSKNETVDMLDVKQKMEEKSAILIDSRSRERYLGKVEPLYKKSGHIPGAKNYFWENVFDDEGNWKDTKELKRHFVDLPKDEEIIVSCGSGVSACPNILALKQAGFKNVKLYPGSFSDWISYDDNRLETKEE